MDQDPGSSEFSRASSALALPMAAAINSMNEIINMILWEYWSMKNLPRG
jgi:hypothetical protein